MAKIVLTDIEAQELQREIWRIDKEILTIKDIEPPHKEYRREWMRQCKEFYNMSKEEKDEDYIRYKYEQIAKDEDYNNYKRLQPKLRELELKRTELNNRLKDRFMPDAKFEEIVAAIKLVLDAGINLNKLEKSIEKTSGKRPGEWINKKPTITDITKGVLEIYKY